MSKYNGNGFYKRRRGILEHLEAGTIGLIDLGIHDYLNLIANLVIGSDCSIPPGVCFTSSPALHAFCRQEVAERTLRRSLERLERIGWIKRWFQPGKRGNYPVLICRASVHDMSGVEWRVDGENTTDWRHPKLIPAEERPQSVRDVSGYREVRNKNREKPPRPSALEDGFESFWNIFPRKEAKKDAQEAWAKIPAAERPAVIAGIERFKLTKQWQKEGGQFVPYAASFLNGRRWEDELTSRSPQVPNGPNGHVPHIPTAADCRPDHSYAKRD